ncbi:MAG: hypothetical protein ACJ76S_08545, partial [Solirubrobacteraceae bacterium]
GAAGSPAPDRRRSRGEARDAQARARLAPLAEGERPVAVTVAAVTAAVLALANLVAYLAGLEVNGQRPALVGMIVYEALLITAAVGMWRVRYWAVLGFEFMLGFLIVFLALFLVQATSLLRAALVLAIGIPAGALFWFLVRAMARIQMPERHRAEP